MLALNGTATVVVSAEPSPPRGLGELELAVDRRRRRAVQVLDDEVDGEQRRLAVAVRLHHRHVAKVVAELAVHVLRRVAARKLVELLGALEDARLAGRAAALRLGGVRLLRVDRVGHRPARHVGVLAALARRCRRRLVRARRARRRLRRRDRLGLLAGGQRQRQRHEDEKVAGVRKHLGLNLDQISTAAAPT
jgi:hypothetical protein